MTEKRRVVITGMGTVNPLGNTLTDYWHGLTTGKSGIGVIDHFDTTGFTTTIAGTVKDLSLEDHFDKKEARRLSRFIALGVIAAREAVKDSGLDIAKEANDIGVEVGSGIGGIDVLENTCSVLFNRGPSKVSPFTVPMMIADMASGKISIDLGAKGINSCTVTACSSAANSIGNAYRYIQDGIATAMITGGAEACVTPLGVSSFCAARSLSQNNDNPQQASRPFDGTRDGFVMGEGAGIVVLEEREHALARGAKIYAEVIGYGASGDAYHITAPAPEGEGATRALKMAINQANITGADIDYINAHGTSTVLNDKNETAAFKTVFGEDAYKISISSTKSMTGHLLGAAGAVELIASSLAIQNNIVPPTINYNTPDPDCDLDYTPNQAKEKQVDTALSTSFGFGGHNAVLVIRRHS